MCVYEYGMREKEIESGCGSVRECLCESEIESVLVGGPYE